MVKIKIRQHRSSIKKLGTQKKTLKALGLGEVGKVVVHRDTPTIQGMVNKVKHLVSVAKTE